MHASVKDSDGIVQYIGNQLAYTNHVALLSQLAARNSQSLQNNFTSLSSHAVRVYAHTHKPIIWVCNNQNTKLKSIATAAVNVTPH